MPRAARFLLKWSAQESLYALYERDCFLSYAHDSAWHHWLTEHTSFAFQGQHNHFTLLKETRKNKGEGYWYAYQRHGKQVHKYYIGRSAELTPERLEEITLLPLITTPPPQLLAPRFQIPQLPASLITREHLLTQLDAGLEQRITLISAPAGSGKTTLVNHWLAQHRTDAHVLPVVWLSLESSDNDPLRFWRYVLTACDMVHAGSAQAALAQLTTLSQFPYEGEFLETVLTTLLNDLSRHKHKALLILEDYHLIISPSIHRTLTFLLDHLPASLHPVIMTRGDLPLPLGRLRIRGELCELHAPDLRFSAEESTTFLRQFVPATTTKEMLRVLDDRLEGWAAGLRLFVLSLQHSRPFPDIEQSIVRFLNAHQPLHDYFVTEVLNAQSEQIQTFLLTTCHLDRLTASLCDTLTSNQDSHALLEQITHMGLFIERLDGPGQWYRYHALFAQALQAEARKRLGETALHTVFLQASHWYEQHDLLPEAIEAALQAESMSWAAEIIQRYLEASGIDNIQEFQTLCRWLQPLPDTLLHERPLLCLSYAQALALSFAPDYPPPTTITHIAQLLELAETRWYAEGNMVRLGQVSVLRMQKALWENNFTQALSSARCALNWLPPEMIQWRAMCLNIVGAGELASGQIIQARQIVQEAQALWIVIGHPHGARSCMLVQAAVYFEEGELQLASACYHQVLQAARVLADREDIIPALIGQARLHYEWNDLATAEQLAQEACDLSEQMHNLDLRTHAELVLILTMHSQGRQEQARHCLTTLLTRTQPRPELFQEVQLCQVRLLLIERDFSAAQHHLENPALQDEQLSPSAQEQKELLQATLYLRQRNTQPAQQTLARLLTATQQAGRSRIGLAIQLLIAQAQQARQHTQTARQTLRTILSIAHTEGYRRIFIDQGQDIVIMLRGLQTHVHEQPLALYLRTLIQAIEPTSPATDDVRATLSPQEQRVLRLLMAERTYPEIAQELVVSPNTIKTQVRSIYRKLNVRNRREARAMLQSRQPR